MRSIHICWQFDNNFIRNNIETKINLLELGFLPVMDTNIPHTMAMMPGMVFWHPPPPGQHAAHIRFPILECGAHTIQWRMQLVFSSDYRELFS